MAEQSYRENKSTKIVNMEVENHKLFTDEAEVALEFYNKTCQRNVVLLRTLKVSGFFGVFESPYDSV